MRTGGPALFIAGGGGICHGGDEWSARTSVGSKELNVLKLLAQGLGTIAIAEQLGIDPRSVQNYITTLRRKIGCAERIQLVDWYNRMYVERG